VDKFIFPSKSTYAYFEKNTNINKKRFTILPNFVSTGGMDTYSKGSDFLYSGRLFVEKGILDLISVFEHRKLGNLLVLGNGNLKKSVAKAAAINKNIHYLGFKNRDKLVKIQSNAYFTIIPSKCLEVFPNVLLESLSVGTPVIAPNVAPFNEIIKNKVNGFLYDFNRAGSLEKAISLASKLKSKKYLAMRKNAVKKYKLFTPEAYYSQILSLYKSLNVRTQ
jgi:glycosyltransferase involved in cell wall biosynthesis